MIWAINLACLAIGFAWVLAFRARERRVSLPPSPPGHWFLGNRHLLEGEYTPMMFGTKLKRLYGDIISIITPFETIVVLNTIDTATEILEKEAAITASRPTKAMLDYLMGWGKGVGWHKYNDRYKNLRKMMAAALSPAAARYYTEQHAETTAKLLKRLSTHSVSYVESVHQTLVEFYMSLSYGYTVVENDPFVPVADQAMMSFVQAYSTRFWVDNFPILRFLPAWFPATEFQKIGKQGKELRERYVNQAFDDLLNKMRNGEELQPSYCSRLLEEKGALNADSESMDLIKLSAAAILAGGSSTVLSTVIIQFLMMALYPEITKKAQAEIDAVTGRDRLPRLQDVDEMPYCGAYFQEVLRTYPDPGLTIPHELSENLEFHGYIIPKGTAIYGNMWGMVHDSDYYDSPFSFNPSRFLGPNPEPDPRKYVFGFGRRQCPGMHITNHALWIICTSVLAIYDVKPREELLARVAEVGGRDSERMYEILHHYLDRNQEEAYELVPRDSVATTLLEGC